MADIIPDFSVGNRAFTPPVTPLMPAPKPAPVFDPVAEAARKARLNAESVQGLVNEAGPRAAPNIGEGAGVYGISHQLPTLAAPAPAIAPAPLPAPEIAPAPTAVPVGYQPPAFAPAMIAPVMAPSNAAQDIWKKTMDYVNQGATPEARAQRLALGTHLAGQVVGQETNQNKLQQQGMIEEGAAARGTAEINAANAREAAKVGSQYDIEAQKLHADKTKAEQERWQFLPNIGEGGIPASPTHAMDIRTGTVKAIGAPSAAPVEGATSKQGNIPIVYKNGAWVKQ